MGPLRLWNPHSADGHLAVVEKNFVDHTLTDQTSVLRFIEDNWLNGARIQRGASFDGPSRTCSTSPQIVKTRVS
jgi:hypothetical protein